MYDYRQQRMSPKRLKIIKLLLEYGANPHKVSILGYTALDLVRMHRPLSNGTPVGVEDNDAEIIELLKEYMKLWSDQKLSYMSALNPRLGRDSPFNYLDHDTMLNLEKYLDYNPDITTKYGKEKRRNKYTKSRQRLSLMKGLEDRDSLLGNLPFETGILEHISKHASRIKPLHSIQEQMLLEDRQDEPEPET